MMFNCKVMRNILVTSATLLFIGFLLILLASQVINHSGMISLAINALGILSLLLAPALFLLVIVLALMPGARKSLSLCNH